MLAALSAGEVRVLLWIQAFLRNPVTDPLISAFTHLGDKGLLFIALTVLLLLCPKTRRMGLAAALGLLCSLLFTNLALKPLFQRPRPWVDFPALLPLVAEHDPNSFPSGHTSAAFAFALAVARTEGKRWLKTAAIVLAVLMGLSRLYVGVHYPTDVAVGFLVGDLAGLLGAWLAHRLVLWYRSRAKTA